MRQPYLELILALDEREATRLMEYATDKDIPPWAVMMQALRTYDMVEQHRLDGHRMVWMDKDGNIVKEKIGGCMGDE